MKHDIQWNNGKLLQSEDQYSEKDNILAQIYKNVTRATLIKVYRKYKFDYELFGYDFDEVLKLAGYELLSKKERSMKPTFY